MSLQFEGLKKRGVAEFFLDRHKDFVDHMGGQALLMIGRWYPKSSIDQSLVIFFTHPTREIFAPKVSTHSLSSLFCGEMTHVYAIRVAFVSVRQL